MGPNLRCDVQGKIIQEEIDQLPVRNIYWQLAIWSKGQGLQTYGCIFLSSQSHYYQRLTSPDGPGVISANCTLYRIGPYQTEKYDHIDYLFHKYEVWNQTFQKKYFDNLQQLMHEKDPIQYAFINYIERILLLKLSVKWIVNVCLWCITWNLPKHIRNHSVEKFLYTEIFT